MSFPELAIFNLPFLDRFRIFSVISATLPFRYHWFDLDTQVDVAFFNRQLSAKTGPSQSPPDSGRLA
ncbi:hypothetical protein EAH72_33580 [Pseudomonas caspiana]|nr:hypothetical protein EAH72_33580 [Pseudomonas caspiana]